ncbi:pimeloyl-ACP methyl ester carboxylesterase [Paenibacillus sediminis]|uniref:Pimeloyl-ACP methyl ester carboxylesterase n=1 Tax=Paenibacillus sediminis TaxID=664909 RepID=A0ABS4H0S7_9BACL|nr:pimeloyl-ACP methyl ester carboxylesterase [Paenibacillus sediminis]
MKSIELPNGETMGYRERAGGDEIVLLVHGNMNSSKHWDVVIENLDSAFKVFAVDLRGFGISTYHRPIEDLTDYSRDLKMFTEALGLSSFHLVGWSTGGGVVMQYAADYPEQVKKLILLASMSTRGYPFYYDNEQGLPDLGLRITTREGIEQLARTQMVSAAAVNRDKAFMKSLFDFAVYNGNKPDPERYEEYLDDILTQRNLADIYHGLNIFNISSIDNEAAKGTRAADRIQASALVIRGNNDLVITEQMFQEILEDLGERARPVLMDNCGHSPLIDNLPLLLQHMTDFLKEQ